MILEKLWVRQEQCFSYCDLAEVGFLTDRLGLTYCDPAGVTFIYIKQLPGIIRAMLMIFDFLRSSECAQTNDLGRDDLGEVRLC